MSQFIAILGRQPALGIAELESIYGSSNTDPLNGAALLNIESLTETEFARLGGVLKVATLLARINNTEWAAIIKYIASVMPQYLHQIPDGKIRFGLSVYGLPIKSATINRSGLEIKKIIKRAGRSVRVVPNTAPELSTAQTLHNQLTGSAGIELILVRQGQQTLLGRVTHVQNINAYAARDQKRPMRDARVGMLPPKLAQIIINLAVGSQPLQPGITILDPFCGTGVILQEALLDGCSAIGTDLEPRMIEYSQTNLEWLKQRADFPGSHALNAGDATNQTWSEFNTVACETYLGRPFADDPTPEVLQEVLQDVDHILRKFLQNLARQTVAGTRMCLAVPAWKTTNGFKHLKMLDSLEDMGYTRISFKHVSADQLIYHRPEQIVARELVVLTRK